MAVKAVIYGMGLVCFLGSGNLIFFTPIFYLGVFFYLNKYLDGEIMKKFLNWLKHNFSYKRNKTGKQVVVRIKFLVFICSIISLSFLKRFTIRFEVIWGWE